MQLLLVPRPFRALEDDQIHERIRQRMREVSAFIGAATSNDECFRYVDDRMGEVEDLKYELRLRGEG